LHKRGFGDVLQHTHGEALFKRALTNCFTFADSLTVVGPFAMLQRSYGSSSWPTVDSVGVNNFKSKVKETIATTKGKAHLLHSLGRGASPTAIWSELADSKWVHPYLDWTNWGYMDVSDVKEKVDATYGDMAWQFNNDLKSDYSVPMKYASEVLEDLSYPSVGEYTGKMRIKDLCKDSLGVFALIFTYKTVATAGRERGGANDLTAMEFFPPTVFLVPASFILHSVFLLPEEYNDLSSDAVNAMTALMSPRHFIPREMALAQPPCYNMSFSLSSSLRDCAPTVGCPFHIQTVSMAGKTVDPFRAIANALIKMMSEKAQYAAWTIAAASDSGKMPTRDVPVRILFDPIAAGRRVRNHNRGEFSLTAGAINYNSFPGKNTGQAYWYEYGASAHRLITRYRGNAVVVTPSWLSLTEQSVNKVAALVSSYFRSLEASNMPGYHASGVCGLKDIFGATQDLPSDKMGLYEICASDFETRKSDYITYHVAHNSMAFLENRVDFDENGVPNVFGVSNDVAPDLLRSFAMGNVGANDKVATAIRDTLKVSDEFKFDALFKNPEAIKERILSASKAVGKAVSDISPEEGFAELFDDFL
jgi:hypothetical protein